MPGETTPAAPAPVLPSTVKMQLCTTVIDVPPAKVDAFKAQGWQVITDRLPYVAPPKQDAEPGCC